MITRLATAVLVCASLLTHAGALPTPLLELRFEGDARNAGALGGEGELVEYAPGEGPVFDHGIRGTAISFARASRSGGTSLTEQAGGAVVFGDEALAGLRQCTLSAWIFPLDTTGPARIIYTPREWDLMTSNLRVTLKYQVEGKDHFLHAPRDSAPMVAEQWNFIAVTVDFEAQQAAMYVAPLGAELALAGRWDDLPEMDRGDGVLQIGNLGGIRPLKGLVDNVRVFDAALSESEVRALHEADLPQKRTLQGYPRTDVGTIMTEFSNSDVFFSTRWGRDNAVENIRAFGANRVVWVYTSDANFVASVRETGATVQGAINSVPRMEDLSGYAVDLDGTILIAPWMAGWGAKWGCNNQPAFREAVLKNARGALDAGVDWLQYDDGALNVSAHSWGGGCMCDPCMEAFREYLRGVPEETLREAGIEDPEGFDYREFLAERHDIRDAAAYKAGRGRLPTTPLFEDYLRRSVLAYFADLRRELDAHAGRRVPLSVNMNLRHPTQRHAYLLGAVDFLIGETWSLAPADLALSARAGQALGRRQITSPYPHNINDTRLALATTYALGEFFLVPWDVWMGPDAPERYFGTVEQYGDMYDFVRGNPELFDSFEAPARVAVIVNTESGDAARARQAVERLLAARVPFALELSGRRYFEARLDADRLAGYDLLMAACDLEGLPEEDRAALEAARRETPLLPDDRAADRLLARFAPVDVWGPETLHVFPRVAADPASRTLVCHVLNYTQAGEERAVLPLRFISLGLRETAMLGPAVLRATWHEPGREPVEMMVDELAEGVRLIVPQVREWGIARVEFAAGE